MPSVHPEQPSYEPTTNPTIEEPSDEKKGNGFANMVIVAAFMGFMWALYEGHIALPCPPKRSNSKYGPVSGRDHGGADSDDDGDDPTARRRMMELSSFGPKKTGGPSQRASVVQSDSSSPNRRDQQSSGSFPASSFSSG